MKRNISLILSIAFAITIAQVYSQTYLISQGGSVTTCSGFFYDSGGPTGNYGNSEEYIMTFYPSTSGAMIIFDFTSFNVVSNPVCNQDFLMIYDGATTAAPEIGTYCNTDSPGMVTATNSDGALTFYFRSNRAQNSAGWEAEISCYIPPTLGLWTGNVSSDWNDPSNWFNNSVPVSVTNVTIPSTAPNWPFYAGNMTLGTTCQSIAMDGESELTITGNLTIPAGKTFISTGSSYIRIGGDISRTGLFDPGTGTVELYGSSQSIIEGPSATNYLINEDFSIFPGNWLGNTSLNPTANHFYQVNTANAGGASPEIRFQSAGSNQTQERRVYHLPVNTAGAKSLTLEFNHSLDYGSGDYTIKVQYSTDMTSWQDAGWSVNPTGNIPATTVSIPLTVSQGVGNAVYFIGFTIDGKLQNVNYWYIDDVRLSYSTTGNPITFYNLVINKSNAEVIADGDIEVANNFAVRPNAWFTNSMGKTFDISGNAIFEADASSMASFIDNGTTTIAGTTTVEQFVTSERWHLVGPPVTDATISPYFDMYLKHYNEPDDTWTYLILPLTIPMNVAGGYAAWASNSLTGTKTVSFSTSTGNLNNSNYYIDTLSFTPGAPIEGFNLLSNPYISALDWNTNWNMNNMSGWMVIYDNGVYRGYHTDGSNYNDGTSIIPSTQGFWVRALGSNANITIPRSQRVHNAQSFYKNESFSAFPGIRLVSEINGMKDETSVLFSTDVSFGFNGFYDLFKFENAGEAPTLFTILDGKDYGVKFLPESFQDLAIPVGFTTGEQGTYLISAQRISGFDPNIHILLEDKKLGTKVELNENSSVEFLYMPGDNPHRFNLMFKDMSMDIPESALQRISIFSHEKTVHISLPEMQTGTATIHDLLGKKILQDRVTGESLNLFEINNSSGYYIVQVKTDTQVVTQKVFIR